MKEFFKTLGASFLAVSLFGVISIFILIYVLSGLLNFGPQLPQMPAKAVLEIDMSTIVLSEQTQEPITSIPEILDGEQLITPLGIFSTIQAINAAAADPAVEFIYLKPDATVGGLAQIEELRKALINFRKSGKAVVSYLENPTNAGYYLATASDKIYMTSHDGGLNTFNGISTQLIFIKDALDKLGINAQLIRHGKYKSAGEMFVRNSSSKENMEQHQAMINSVWESWSQEIAEARGIPVEKINEAIDNLSLNSPADFLEIGLVDELLTGEQMKQKLADLYMTPDPQMVEGISLLNYTKLLTPVKNEQAKVAIIYVDGNIIDGSKKQEVAGDRFAKIISDVRCNTAVKAVVLRVNSPGGSVLASEKIKAELELLKERVPVIASFGDYAASGGYWISAGCDKIFANKTSLTGSIGVFSLIPDFQKTMKNKLHVNITSVNSNKHSDMYGMMRPLQKSEKEYMQASVEQIYNKFTEIVATGREMRISQVDSLGQGRVWTGADAQKIGLVDEIGTLEDAVNFAAMSVAQTYDQTNIEILEVPRPVSGVELLLESFGYNLGASIPKIQPLKAIERAFKDWNANQSGKVYARIPYEYVIQ